MRKTATAQDISKLCFIAGEKFRDVLPKSALRGLELISPIKKKLRSVTLIAQELRKQIKNVEYVYILTGFPCKHNYETDGPIGSLLLANFLTKFHQNVVILANDPLDLNLRTISRKIFLRCAFTVSNPSKISNFSNSLLISIEYPGMNEFGIQHTMNGQKIRKSLYPTEKIIKINSPIYWLAIGDGGNEIGLGKLRTQVEDIIPNGKKCQCGCGGGIAVELAASDFLIGFTSNFAAIALLFELADQSHLEPEFNWTVFGEILQNLNHLGIVDGISQEELSVDNMGIVILEKFYAELQNMYR